MSKGLEEAGEFFHNALWKPNLLKGDFLRP